MKKNLFLLLLAITGSLSLSGQTLKLGLRDNQYGYAAYRFENNFSIKLEHSLFTERIGYQYVKVFVGYEANLKPVKISFEPYYGRTYNGSFYNLGGLISCTYPVTDILQLKGVVNPNYDSKFKYETCFGIEGQAKLLKDIAFVAEFTNVPEYRMKEDRVKLGLLFKVDQLWVKPCISLETKGAKTTRVLTSFEYTF